MTIILVPKLFRFAKIFRFGISAPHFSVGETLRVTYFLLFQVNTKYVPSRELKTLDVSLVLRTRVNADVFNKLDGIYIWYSPKKYILNIKHNNATVWPGVAPLCT